MQKFSIFSFNAPLGLYQLLFSPFCRSASGGWAVFIHFFLKTWKLFFEQFYFIGNKSLLIICLAGSFTGMVMAYQVYFGFQMISVDSLVGPVVTIALAKELAPVLTGLIVAGRAGAAHAL